MRESGWYKAKDIAYNIIKLRKSSADVDEEVITAMKTEIRKTLKDVDYKLSTKQTEDGIQAIFDDSLKI